MKYIYTLLFISAVICVKSQSLYQNIATEKHLLSPASTTLETKVLAYSVIRDNTYKTYESAASTKEFGFYASLNRNSFAGAKINVHTTGINKQTDFSLAYNYRIDFNYVDNLILGLWAGIVSKDMNIVDVYVFEEGDRTLEDRYFSKAYFSSGFGAQYTVGNYRFDVVLPRMINEYGAYNNDFIAMGSLFFSTNGDDENMCFHALFNHKTGYRNFVDLGLNGIFNEAITLGAGYQTINNVYGSVGYRHESNLEVSVSYSHSINGEVNPETGAIQFNLNYKMMKSRKKRSAGASF